MTEMTLTEAAAQLGVAASTLRGQVAKGRLRARVAAPTPILLPFPVLMRAIIYGLESGATKG